MKGLAYGNNFDAPSILNTVQYQRLWDTFSNCIHQRANGQEILYKCVTFSERSNLELFARTISQNQNIRDLVGSLPISVPLFGSRLSYQSYNNRNYNYRPVLAEQVDTSRLLGNVMNNCSLIHVLSIDMPDDVNAFDILVGRQKFSKCSRDRDEGWGRETLGGNRREVLGKY